MLSAEDNELLTRPKRDYFSSSVEWDYPAVVKAQAVAREVLNSALAVIFAWDIGEQPV